MHFTPLPQQTAIIEHLRANARALVFVVVGGGKTAGTLLPLAERMLNGEIDRILVICPHRVITSWENQVAKWDFARWMTPVNLRSKGGLCRWNAGDGDIFLINPEKLPDRGDTEGMAKALFKGRRNLPKMALVIDESSLAKNPRGKRFRAIKPYLKRFPVRVALTGTPTPNTILEVHHQVALIDDGERLGRSYFQFRKTYAESDYMGWKWALKDGAEEKIRARIADITLSMTDGDVLDLPPAETSDEWVDMPDRAARAYRQMRDDFIADIDDGEEITAASAAVKSGKLLQIASGMVYDENGDAHTIHTAKLERLAELAATPEQVIVLAGFKAQYQAILDAVPGAVMFDERLIPDWRSERIKAFVAHPKQFSHGIDGLQHSCRRMIWVTPTWSSETYDQMVGRLQRTGQSRQVQVIRIMARGTIDPEVSAVLEGKQTIQQAFLKSLSG